MSKEEQVRHARTAFIAACAAALLTIAGAGAAHAASRTGTLNCPDYYPTGKVTSSTTGATRHTWVDSDSGAVRIIDFTGGVARTSMGFHRSAYVVTASTITSASGTCA